MNILDIIVLAILITCLLYFSYKGLVLALFDFLSLALSLFLAWMVFPIVSGFIESSTGLYAYFQEGIAANLGIDQSVAAGISALNLPDFMKKLLLANDSAVTRSALGVDSLNGYIAAFLAHVAISAISMVAVFAVAFIAMKLIGFMLDVASRLPVINTMNKIGGAVLGLIIAFIIISALTSLPASFTLGGWPAMAQLLDDSVIARFFRDHNLFMMLAGKVIGN